ncbi:hypothetical protein, partial [Roseixanthobacter glucoisosaccharinicivorans]|uniref:hypothetical protein n=1 Tax=Roseixanthobacter glucoisosaccharinicivorans TaxID=3119923 RepID=UPI003727329F
TIPPTAPRQRPLEPQIATSARAFTSNRWPGLGRIPDNAQGDEACPTSQSQSRHVHSRHRTSQRAR